MSPSQKTEKLHEPEVVKKVFEKYQKGETEQDIANFVNREYNLDVTNDHISKLLNRPLLQHDQNFIAANKEANNHFKKKIDTLADHIIESAQTSQEKLEELIELVDEHIKDVEKEDKIKIGYINSLKGLSNSVSRTLELQSKFVESLRPQKINISNVNITNRIVQLIKKINLCSECQRKFSDYLGTYQGQQSQEEDKE